MNINDQATIDLEEQLSPSERVFNIDLLLDKILYNVVLSEWGPWKKTNIKSCRLVNKNWLRSTNHCLFKARSIFYEVRLYRENEGGKLNQFLTILRNNQRLELGIPPVQITVHTSPFLTEDNRESFLDLLSLCRACILEMTLYFGDEGCSGPLALPDSCSFDNLYRLYIEKEGKVIGESPFLDSFLDLIQSILDGSPKLKAFKGGAATYYVEPDIRISSPTPQKFQSLILPPSTQNLSFYAECFDLLMRNSLPIVTKLSITLPIAFSNGDMLSQVLHKLRTSLEVLKIFERKITQLKHVCTYSLEMPLMERLTLVEDYMRNIKLEFEKASLPQKVPKLSELKLETLDLVAFQNWISGSRLESVKRLSTSIGQTFTEEMWQSLTLAFPNLEFLSLDIDMIIYPRQLEGLGWIFRNMKKLKCLKITFQNAKNMRNDWNLFYARIIGTTKETAAQLLANPSSWKQMDLDKTSGIPSIRDLTDLEELYLDIKEPRLGYVIQMRDVAFHLAFLKMDRLKMLEMSPWAFFVSRQMRNHCVDKGLTMRCSTADP